MGYTGQLELLFATLFRGSVEEQKSAVKNALDKKTYSDAQEK